VKGVAVPEETGGLNLGLSCVSYYMQKHDIDDFLVYMNMRVTSLEEARGQVGGL